MPISSSPTGPVAVPFISPDFDANSYAGDFFEYLQDNSVVSVYHDRAAAKYRFYKMDGTFTAVPAGGSGGSSVTFNGDRPITANIPGLTGVVLGGNTLGEVELNFYNYLYPALGPNVSLSASGSQRELGSGGSTVLTYTVSLGTNPLNSIEVNGVGVDPDVLAGTVNANTAPDTNTTFSLTATDNASPTLSSTTTASVSYLPARFYGTSARDHTQMTLALSGGTAVETVAPEFSKQLATDYRVNQNYNCTGGRYIHVLFPASFGTPTLVRSGLLDFSAYTLSPVSTTDLYGVSRSYKLLTTFIQNGASVNINIVN